MRNSKIKFSFRGMFIFLISILLISSICVTVYVLVTMVTDNKFIQIIVCLLVSMFLALNASIIDFARRKGLETKINEILDASEEVIKGNMQVRVYPIYKGYKEYNEIIINLNKMIEALSQQEIYKKDFIANLSHEIKTPLAIIQNYAIALNSENLTVEKRKEYSKILVDNCKKLSNLITNILKLNKLENQTYQLTIKKINLGEFLRENILKFEDLIEDKNFDLKIDIDEIMVNTDESMMEIVINNLLANAIKFTDNNGQISISLKQNQGNFVLIVKDNGCGMDKETGKHIFDRFYQGDTSHAKEGNGLGLALVKNVIDTLGGQISVSSELEKGSTFIVECPIKL